MGIKVLVQKLVTVLFLLHLLAGIVLCSCGTMSIKMTYGQSESHGPPYYIGTFIVGALVSLTCLSELSSSSIYPGINIRYSKQLDLQIDSRTL